MKTKLNEIVLIWKSCNRKGLQTNPHYKNYSSKLLKIETNIIKMAKQAGYWFHPQLGNETDNLVACLVSKDNLVLLPTQQNKY